MKKTLTVMLFSIMSAACKAEPIGIGFLESTPLDRPNEIILYSSQKIEDNSTIDFEYNTASGETKCCQRISGGLFKEIETSDRVSAADKSAPIYFYTAPLSSLSSKNMESSISIAVINADATKKTAPDVISARKGSDQITIERCYGTEGINLFEKRNRTTVEHLYLYLNYDIDPTCR